MQVESDGVCALRLALLAEWLRGVGGTIGNARVTAAAGGGRVLGAKPFVDERLLGQSPLALGPQGRRKRTEREGSTLHVGNPSPGKGSSLPGSRKVGTPDRPVARQAVQLTTEPGRSLVPSAPLPPGTNIPSLGLGYSGSSWRLHGVFNSPFVHTSILCSCPSAPQKLGPLLLCHCVPRTFGAMA